MAYQYIVFEKEDKVITISLNRPPTNPLNEEFGRELFAAFSAVEQMEDVNVVIIASALEKAFIAGADIKELAIEGAPERLSALLQGANNILSRMKKIVIAAISGHALGGGCELVMACDYRIMVAGKTLIGLPEAGLGILPGAGGTQRLPRLVGLSKALDILVRGRVLGAQEALEIGLVDRVVEAEMFKEEVMKFARELASGAGKAMGNIKAAVYEGYDLPMEQALAVERKYNAENAKTYDAKEGLTAFIEKRKPVFLSK